MAHRRAEAGPVAEVAHSELVRVEVLAGEPRLDLLGSAVLALDLLQVLDLKARHRCQRSPSGPSFWLRRWSSSTAWASTACSSSESSSSIERASQPSRRR